MVWTLATVAAVSMTLRYAPSTRTPCKTGVLLTVQTGLQQTPGHPWNARAFGPARALEFWKAPK